MTRKASAARMSILILIAEPQLSSPVRGMTRSRAMQKKQAQKKCPHKGGHNKLRRAQRQQLNCQRASLQIYL